MDSVTAPAISGLGQPLARLLLPLDHPSGRPEEFVGPPLPSVGIPFRGRECCQRLVVPEQLSLLLGGGSSFLDVVHQRIRSRAMDGEHDPVDGGLGLVLLVLHVVASEADGLLLRKSGKTCPVTPPIRELTIWMDPRIPASARDAPSRESAVAGKSAPPTASAKNSGSKGRGLFFLLAF